MKKTLLCIATAFFAMTSATAQVDSRIFNHLSAALNVGTPGIGADVAVPCTRFLDFEAGFSIMPKITYNTDVHLNMGSFIDPISNTLVNLSTVPIQGKLNMVNGKFLINFYPFPLNSFHITAGAYFGKGSIVEVRNTIPGQLSAISEYNKSDIGAAKPIGVEVGDYLLKPDDNGDARATLNTNGFKPYLGLGYGRAVPHKRVGFKVDLGVMFWGTPDVVDHNGVSLSKQDLDNSDGGAFRVISKFKVYPVLNFRLCGRIF
ncbi:MAG: hypothetical protein IK144_12625 [Bacteroidaceae bacterium]|nr:hypothetical protein [Bacteroidaceae bacterium]